MSRRAAVFTVLGALGFALYLWPALRAPVVMWSDSAINLDLARRGAGIITPVPSAPGDPPAHTAKPFYLLFLRAGLALASGPGEIRPIVILQAALLWISIMGSCLFVAKRSGVAAGLGACIALLLLLRLRDSTSAIMPEALSAALFLPIATRILWPPRTQRGCLLLGIAIASLFWVRPNVGAIALVLGIAAAGPYWRAILSVLAGFVILFAPIWVLTNSPPGGQALRGLAYPLLEGSADYYWSPSLTLPTGTSSPREHERGEISGAATNWQATLRGKGPDTRRQLIWRAFHGLLGTDFYDAGWSGQYRRWDTLSRIATPFFLLAAVAVSLTARFRKMGTILLALLVLQSLAIGANPRYALPFLPAFLLLGASTLGSLDRFGTRRRLAAAAILGGLLALAATHAYVLDWQAGSVESSGITIRQRVPKGALPEHEPATLHVRIAPPVLPSSAQLQLTGPGGELLYTSESDRNRREPAITVPLPQTLLDASSRRAIELELTSFGSYGQTQHLLFPVIPPPWRPQATREGSEELSPSTAIRSGSLDWWAHAGSD